MASRCTKTWTLVSFKFTLNQQYLSMIKLIQLFKGNLEKKVFESANSKRKIGEFSIITILVFYKHTDNRVWLINS